MYYGESKERVRLYNLLRRLELGHSIPVKDIGFIRQKVKLLGNRKFWPGADFLKDGIERAIERLKYGNRKNINRGKQPQNKENDSIYKKGKNEISTQKNDFEEDKWQ